MDKIVIILEGAIIAMLQTIIWMLVAVMPPSAVQNAPTGNLPATDSVPSPASIPTISPEVLNMINLNMIKMMSQEMSYQLGPNFPTPLPGTDDGWVLHVVRSGGGLMGVVNDDFTLNSLGNLSCAVSGTVCGAGNNVIIAEPLIQLTSIIVEAKSLTPDADSVLNSTLGVCSDCVTTGLSVWRRLSGQETRYSAGWDVTTKSKIPPDILKLYDAVIVIRRYSSNVSNPNR